MSTLARRTLFIPRMPDAHAEVAAAAFRGFGVDAWPVPESDERTIQLGRACCSGDECFPLIVTVGDFLKILEDGRVSPDRVAFFMPTSSGPCRFGQYAGYLRSVLVRRGYSQAVVVSPTSQDSYEGVGAGSMGLFRTCWRAFVACDHLVTMQLRTRPYEEHPGDTDRAFARAVEVLVEALERGGGRLRFGGFLEAVAAARDLLRAVRVRRGPRPLIGIVGEIFCRNNAFSNMETIRCLERHGAECWMPPLSEWVHYTNLEETIRAKRTRAGIVARARIALKHKVQHHDFVRIARLFVDDLADRPEPEIDEMLKGGAAYLPHESSLGEMALSVARAVYLYRQGVAGIVDISPFTCMNAIVAEAVYPTVSRECDGVPIRTFYFDGTQRNLDRDVGVFLQLARSYAARRKERYKGARAVALANVSSFAKEEV